MKKKFSSIIITALFIPVFITGCALSQDTQKSQIHSIPVNTSIKYNDSAILDFIPVDMQPVPIALVKPAYPLGALKINLRGNVFVKVLLDETGKPKDAKIIKSTHTIFDDSAISAALSSKFEPAIKDGKHISYWVVIPYKFTNRSIASQE
jgi:TonB family protein